MKIAVCDDELIAREEIAAMLDDYLRDENLTAEYTVFEDYETLNPQKDAFDIFLVDYLMPGMNGLAFSQSVRSECKGKKIIIFITQFDEIVYDTFAVQTHRFLKKPLDKEKFREALDSAVCALRKEMLTVQYNGVTTTLNLDDIYYIEIAGKELYIYTEKEQILCRRSIKSMESELVGHNFYRVHRSYIVNMDNIRTFNNSAIEFNNGEMVPVSTRQYHDFCKAYLKKN